VKTLATLLLSFALAATLSAQPPTGPHGPRNYVQWMSAKLNLTADQQSQATTIFNNERSAEAPIHASLKSAHQALIDAEKSNNTVSIEQLSNTIGTLTAQLTVTHSKARAAFYRVLTPEQQTTFQQLESRRPMGPMGFRRGPRTPAQSNGQ